LKLARSFLVYVFGFENGSVGVFWMRLLHVFSHEPFTETFFPVVPLFPVPFRTRDRSVSLLRGMREVSNLVFFFWPFRALLLFFAFSLLSLSCCIPPELLVYKNTIFASLCIPPSRDCKSFFFPLTVSPLSPHRPPLPFLLNPPFKFYTFPPSVHLAFFTLSTPLSAMQVAATFLSPPAFLSFQWFRTLFSLFFCCEEHQWRWSFLPSSL